MPSRPSSGRLADAVAAAAAVAAVSVLRQVGACLLLLPLRRGARTASASFPGRTARRVVQPPEEPSSPRRQVPGPFRRRERTAAAERARRRGR